MYWGVPNGAGVVTTWNKISDHNRAPLDISFERFGTDSRMVDSTLRRYSVAKKRTIQATWSMFPSKITPAYGGRTGLGTVDAGWAGENIEDFYNNNNGMFKVRLRKGVDEAKAAAADGIEEISVMITDFSKTIEKRGVVDLWSLSITLEEV